MIAVVIEVKGTGRCRRTIVDLRETPKRGDCIRVRGALARVAEVVHCSAEPGEFSGCGFDIEASRECDLEIVATPVQLEFPVMLGKTQDGMEAL